MAKAKNYAKGVFGKVRTTSMGDIYALAIKKEEFLEWFKGVKPNDAGYVNIDVSKQKDPSKLSVWENDFKPDKGGDLPF